MYLRVPLALLAAGCMSTDLGYTDNPECDVFDGSLDFRTRTDARGLTSTDNLCVRGEVIISGGALVDLEDLAWLREVDSLVIRNTRALRSLAGLDSVRVLKRLVVDNAPELEALGFDQLELAPDLDELVIKQAPRLADISALEELVSLGGSLSIEETAAVDLGPLTRLETVAGSLTIATNRRLRSLDGPIVFTSVGAHLTIRDNAVLADTIAISDNLSDVGGDITVVDNPLLSGCRAAEFLDIPSASALVADNGVEFEPCYR